MHRKEEEGQRRQSVEHPEHHDQSASHARFGLTRHATRRSWTPLLNRNSQAKPKDGGAEKPPLAPRKTAASSSKAAPKAAPKAAARPASKGAGAVGAGWVAVRGDAPAFFFFKPTVAMESR